MENWDKGIYRIQGTKLSSQIASVFIFIDNLLYHLTPLNQPYFTYIKRFKTFYFTPNSEINTVKNNF